MKFAVRLAASCLLAVTGTAQSQNAGSAMFKSLYAAHEVPLDTDPRSNFWREATPVYISVDARGNPQPRYRSAVRSRWTDQSLYVFFECPYEELHLKPDPDTLAETNELWMWDVAEIFIGSDF